MKLSIEHVTKKFGNLAAVNDCSLSLDRDGIYGLIGPNGSGKTTLFDVISGFLKPNAGRVLYEGVDVARRNPIAVSKLGIGRTFQLPRVFSNLTVEENLESSRSRGFEKSRIHKLMDMFNLTGVRSSAASTLSYGQKKQLELARLLATNPAVLLLDEPTSGLEPSLITVTVDQIKYARGLGKTIFIIEHNMNVIMNLAERIFVLHNGRKIAEGTPDDVKSDEQVIDAYLGEERGGG